MPDLGRGVGDGARWTHRTESGTGPAWRRALSLARAARESGEPRPVLLVNTDAACLLALCLFSFLVPSASIVGCDIVLGRPRGWFSRLILPLKRMLFRRVDLFLFPFLDWTGVREVYGLRAERCRYVPFKSNAWEFAESVPDGDYVLAAGRSMRDLETLRLALDGFEGRAILLLPDEADRTAHGARGLEGALPAALKIERDDGTSISWRRFVRGARVVVVPIRPETIVASGISTCFDAMAFGKCVVVTDSPATRGVLDGGEAIVVPPRDPAALRRALNEAWHSAELRHARGAAGRKLVERIQGTERYAREILEACVRL